MRSTGPGLIGLLCVALLMTPPHANAQEAPEGWGDIDTLSTLYVTDDTGTETAGTLTGLDSESIRLRVGERDRVFEASRVRRIERRGDSLKNGLIIGGVVGAVLGALVVGISDCSEGSSCPGSRVAGVAISAGVHAAAGAGIDALFTGRTTLYEARGESAAQARPQPGALFAWRLTW